MSESRYYVWCTTQGPPTLMHPNVESAREEAKRLAKMNPETDFIVLRSVEMIKYTEFPYRITSFCKK